MVFRSLPCAFLALLATSWQIAPDAKTFTFTRRVDPKAPDKRALPATFVYPQSLAKGFEIDLWALPISRPPAPNGLLMARTIQQDWARIGVKASIKRYEWGKSLNRADNGEHKVDMRGWSGATGEADDFPAADLSCAANRSGVKFCNPGFDRPIGRARTVTDADAEQRNAPYRDAQVIVKRERPWITMAHSAVHIPIRRDVKGFVMPPNGSVEFEGVWRE